MKRLLLGALAVGMALLVATSVASAQDGSRAADLEIANRASDRVVSVNEKFTWTVTIRNDGRASARNVRLVNKLPESVRLNDIIPSQGGPCRVNFPKVTCDPGTIASGQTVTIRFFVQGTQGNTVLKDKVRATSVSENQPDRNVAVSKVRVR